MREEWGVEMGIQIREMMWAEGGGYGRVTDVEGWGGGTDGVRRMWCFEWRENIHFGGCKRTEFFTL